MTGTPILILSMHILKVLQSLKTISKVTNRVPKTLKDNILLLASLPGALQISKMGRMLAIGRVWGIMDINSRHIMVAIRVMGTIHLKMKTTFQKSLKIRIWERCR